MYLQTKTITKVEVYMNAEDNDPDTFEVAESTDVMFAWASLMSVMGKENKIKAIKFFRSTFDGIDDSRIGLREAKAFVEDAMRNY
jgi:ribosomal protein L7/L12